MLKMLTASACLGAFALFALPAFAAPLSPLPGSPAFDVQEANIFEIAQLKTLTAPASADDMKAIVASAPGIIGGELLITVSSAHQGCTCTGCIQASATDVDHDFSKMKLRGTVADIVSIEISPALPDKTGLDHMAILGDSGTSGGHGQYLIDLKKLIAVALGYEDQGHASPPTVGHAPFQLANAYRINKIGAGKVGLGNARTPLDFLTS